MSCPRVLRGGSFDIDSRYLRSSLRDRDVPEGRNRFDGFRLVIKRRKR